MTCKLTVIGYTFQTFMLILSQKFNCKFTILTKDSHLTAWKVSDDLLEIWYDEKPEIAIPRRINKIQEFINKVGSIFYNL